MRIKKLQNMLIENNQEAIIIKNKANKSYFGSLEGSGVYLLVTPTDQIQFFDGRYREEIKMKTIGFKNIEVPQGSYLPKIFEYLNTVGVKKIAIEPDGLSIQDYSKISGLYEIEIWPNQIQILRAVKTEMEIQKIKDACLMTDEIFSEILPEIKVGMKEYELGALIQYAALKRGASSMAFDPIVASGPRSALPHGRPTNREFQQGEFILIDFGITLDGYQSDMTRCVSLGTPTSQLLEIYEVVKRAQQAASDFVKVGVTGREVDQIARNIITDAGYGKYFSHGLGHGIGIGGDAPILNPSSETVLQENMVMTIEPGIYLPDVGGVRIEDDVVIKDGLGVPLNHSTKELLIVSPVYV